MTINKHPDMMDPPIGKSVVGTSTKPLNELEKNVISTLDEDKVSDLDPETIYFLNKILNDLDLKKIRNNILSEALPVRV